MSVVSNDVELGAMPESKGDDETIKITKFHLSDVNLLRHNNNVPKEQLEIPHTQEEHEDIEDLARRLFRNWDILGDGKISVGEITESGLDHEFAVALARVLDCDKSGSITLEDLTNCLTILKFGTMRAKVALLVSFMDREGNHQISYEEAALYMKVAPKEICQKLGLRPDKDLKYEDVLALFMNSDRGEDAINIFCQHILSTLKKRAPLTKSFLASQTALNVEMLKVYMDQLRKLHVSTIFYAALIAMQAALYEYNFTYYYERGMPYAFCIAKGFGMNLRILSIVIFLTMARTTMGLLYNIPFVKYFIPMGFNIQIHSFCGFCLVLHSFGHMIGHIVFHTTYVDGGFATTFEQKSLLTNSPWSQKGKGDAITGYILMGCLLAMAFTALKRGDGSQWYKRFSATHLLYNGWLIFVFLHVPNLWPYFVSIAGLMIIERAYDYFVQTTHSTLAMSRPCSNGVTFLSIPRPRKTAPGYPGSYYRIKVPALSMYEWHPFSLAGSVSSHHLTFFVASVGDWTRDLHKIVSDPELRKHTKIQVQGPFYAPAHTAVQKEATTLLVASGIGVTPFFSVMATKVAEEQNFEYDKDVYQSLFKEELVVKGFSANTIANVLPGKKNWSQVPTTEMNVIEELEEELKVIHMIWTIRDVKELMFYLDYVYELVKHQNNLLKPVVKVQVYLTGLGKSTDATYMMSQTLFLLTLASKTSSYMEIKFGRPDLDKEIKKIDPEQVFYCGGKVLKDTLNDLCAKHRKPFHPEDFDSGTTVLNDGIALFKKLFEKSEKKRRLERRASIHAMDNKRPGPPQV